MTGGITTQAWVLHAGSRCRSESVPGKLTLESFSLPEQRDHEALVEPLYSSWEANIDHAVARDPIDICHQRGEDRVVVGNLGVVRVLRPGLDADRIREGDICLVLPFGKLDAHGYAERVYAYDMPGTVGLLARRTKLDARLLLPVPEHSRYQLPRWAAYARYFTAWDNWKVAHACWRAQMPEADERDHLVFGWGGGVALAELSLARRFGFRAAMTASTDRRLSELARHGITPVDRRRFPDLDLDLSAHSTDASGQLRYRRSERVFLETVAELSDDRGVSIFVDNIGAPLQTATLRALGRQGVLATVGWKRGMKMSHLRASECIKRHLHVHTHVWRYQDSVAIRDYQEQTGWIATVEQDAIWGFDEVPELAELSARGSVDCYFPLVRVNPE